MTQIVVPLIGTLASLIVAYLVNRLGKQRMERETPGPDEARLSRSIKHLEGMLATYEQDRERFIEELERERAGRQRDREERDAAAARADAAQAELDQRDERIAKLEARLTVKDRQISDLLEKRDELLAERDTLRRAATEQGGETAG